mgnify:CR=1 FL=1
MTNRIDTCFAALKSAGRTALMTRPGGTMVLRLRNEPSLIG